MRQHIHWQSTAELPYILNLDELFTPIQTGVLLPYKRMLFHGGEPQITLNKVEPFSELIITQRYNTVADLFDIVLAVNAARIMGFKTIKLVLPYFPAARQDRVCNEGEPLTIKVFADIINSCNFEEVVILCPHSEVTPALINNVKVLDELDYVLQTVQDNINGRHFNIVCPDAGAGKRVGKIVQYLAHNNGHVTFNLIRCEKVRDVKTGELKEFFVQSDDLGGYPTLICDDILSMGGTFVGLGNKLKEKNCGKLMLFTAHADCVIGVQNMITFFDHVYTTNSKRDYDQYHYTFENKLTCYKITL